MNFSERKVSRPGTTRRVRMDGHDYSYPGYYFVTICTHNRQHLLGNVLNETLHLSPAGKMVNDQIPCIEKRFENAVVDSEIVMSNHVHMLIGLAVRTDDEGGLDNLSDVVRWIKNSTAARFSTGVKTAGWPRYDGRVWQKGFHDHIVRNDQQLQILRRYIATNVESWESDKFH